MDSHGWGGYSSGLNLQPELLSRLSVAGFIPLDLGGDGFETASKYGCFGQEKEIDMKKETLVEIIKKRLALEGEELAAVIENPKYQRLFENAAKASRYRLVAEVVASKGCHSGHAVGQRIVFDSAGNMMTQKSPNRVCAFLMPNLTVLINAFFENLMNGRDPNEVMFNRTGCFDVGPLCGGWGHVQVEMRAEVR
jgi:hypothetical protein